jgi:hypothetical protein
MKRLSGFIAAGLALMSLSALFISSGCSPPKPEGLAIYLTGEDIPPSDMPNLSQFNIVDKPIIATSDIVSYNSETHELNLTAGAYQRIVSLKIPMMGKAFVVCVDKKPIYWGAFMAPISSYLFAGVTIMQPLSTQESETIELKLGFLNPPIYGGEDPRGNSEIIQALDKAGKLVQIWSSPMTKVPLPHSMKGYELYSWQQDGQWHFTLITGTNRNKTLEEIISPSNNVTTDEWVQIHVVGVEAIKGVISRIPQGEWVSWLDRLSEPVTTSGVTFALPDAATVAAIEEYAQQCGLNFTAVQVP